MTKLKESDGMYSADHIAVMLHPIAAKMRKCDYSMALSDLLTLIAKLTKEGSNHVNADTDRSRFESCRAGATITANDA